ncbi:hypothetical protein DH2020_011936 [Rehmannia glutinosa]|uniref:VQ domain-containing protein n=1 Tax=Rehmannia glutinosa TaxID=99300 RepID=A0ABR0XEW1_REHGL
MSRSKFNDSDVTKGVRINGPRPSPSPLRINKDSHAIHKSSHHQPVFENSGAKHHHQSGTAKRQPVIIYMHSPKVIRASRHEFMALVQTLTGLSPSDRKENEKTVKSESETSTKDEGLNSNSHEDKQHLGLINNNKVGYDENDLSSICQVSNNNPYLIDDPFFTPSSIDPFFCSSNSMFQSSSSISPSFMDCIKGFPDF